MLAPDLSPITVSTSTPNLLGLRAGQSLTLQSGGALGDQFAVVGGNLDVVGGDLGIFGSVTNGTVNISGGSVGPFFDANDSSVVNISGGSVGSSFNANNGSVFNISGGSGLSFFNANNGSVVNISGGSVGNGFEANTGSEVNISGGTIGLIFDAEPGSVVNISGGMFNTILPDFDAQAGSEINLFGGEFFLDGVFLDSSLTLGQPFTIFDRDVTLSGRLADGFAFSFDLNSTDNLTEDFFDPDATLTVTFVGVVPEPGSLGLLGLGSLILLGRRRKTFAA